MEVVLRDDYRPTTLSGWVRNRSTGGLAISCHEACAEGGLFHVRATTAPDGVPWTPIFVRACTPFVTGWVLHCQFAEAPAEEARLLFG